MKAAIGLLKELEPRSASEGMLAAQMVATHEAAMECLRRAMLSEQTFEERDQNLKHAVKLLGLYERQLAALDKHRGKGQQKVTVKHVHVNEGGQAIVGNVSGNSKANVDEEEATGAIDHLPEHTVQLPRTQAAAARKASRKR